MIFAAVVRFGSYSMGSCRLVEYTEYTVSGYCRRHLQLNLLCSTYRGTVPAAYLESVMTLKKAKPAALDFFKGHVDSQ